MPKKKWSQYYLIASLLCKSTRVAEINAYWVPSCCRQRLSASQPGVPEHLAQGLALPCVWASVFSV